MKQTLIRKKIIAFFKKQKKPITYDKIIDYLIRSNISFDRSTIFRNLNFLEGERIVNRLNFGDGVSRYEFLKQDNHHHHIVCLNCKKVIDFFDEDLDRLVKKIEKRFEKKILFSSNRPIVYSSASSPSGITPA